MATDAEQRRALGHGSGRASAAADQRYLLGRPRAMDAEDFQEGSGQAGFQHGARRADGARGQEEDGEAMVAFEEMGS